MKAACVGCGEPVKLSFKRWREGKRHLRKTGSWNIIHDVDCFKLWLWTEFQEEE